MAIWVDGPKEQPFSGCLVVMNVGEENIQKVPENEKQKIVNAIAAAHARGSTVIYLFDSDVGPMGPPGEFDVIEDRDAIRMAFNVLGQRTLTFSKAAAKRTEEMTDAGVKLGKDLYETSLRFKGDAKFCGYCLVDGKRTFIEAED